MAEKQQTVNDGASSNWHVYIVCCRDSSYYTGITTDLERRIDEHNSRNRGAHYTRSRRPVHLVYFEKAASRSIAARREYQIKRLSSIGKQQLIKTYRPVEVSRTTSQTK
jgi:putative endonuclease